ncbi:MAG: autotransporter domain-containing protein [Pseudomonadota bacterium]|nr:autotransporter domain-containing protein [Pseudomonadota bacterium]
MNTKTPGTRNASGSALLYTSASMIAFLVAAPLSAQTAINDGDNATVTSAADGETITVDADTTSTVDGAPVVVVANNDVTLDNAGTLVTTGVTQTVQINQGTSGAQINNGATGRLEGASRVVNFDGTDAALNNDGVILGTGSQRNGAVYANRTSNNIAINNSATASIDAGVEGAAIAIEVGGGGAPRGGSITNAGVIQGRGQASPMGGTAGDGIRFFGPGLAPDYVYEGDITNSGLINSQSTQGTVAGIRFANRIGFQATLTNEEGGVISGAQNGLYFGNDADHTGGVVNNAGVISSDSRALNIDGTGLVVNNSGSILGTGNQRNGTVYADSTAQSFALNNLEGGLIDAGDGNDGAGFSVELSSDGNDFTIDNAGSIRGRGQAGAGAASAGDGLRFERTRVGGVLEGSTTGLFTGTITNSGEITADSAQGTAAGIRFVNGVSFQGTLDNSGLIAGVQNGLYFGNPVPAGGSDHTGGVVNNSGTISSDSRALNIDGTGLVVNNSGSILGTGNQRNGTVYADSTATGFTLNNTATGIIDAGDGNEGAGFSVELASAETGGSAFDIVNAGTIQGRGNAGAGLATAGDGLRFERTRNEGVLDGTSNGLFVGDIINSGTIASEAANGTAGGIRFVNGVSFQGTLENSGTITGIQNGLYFGNPTPAGGGDFSQAIVNNSGTISSGSRALNIDGIGLTVNNLAGGRIIGLGNQRNGTVYADGTADAFTFTNAGTVDAGAGNQGSGFGAEIGGAVDGANTFILTNTGTIQGRGQAGPMDSQAGDGVRIGNVGNMGVFDGVISNSGLINSESTQGPVSGLRIVNGVDFTGDLVNTGTISGGNHGLYLGAGDHSEAIITNSGILAGGVNAFFAGNATAGVNVTNSGGTLIGNFVGTAFEDTLTFAGAGNALQGSILNGVDVVTSADSTTVISGARSLDGSFTHNGALDVTLGVDSLAIDGDLLLGEGSVINVATDPIRQGDIGTTFDVLTETGAFTNNGAIVNVAENDFLIDFNVLFGSVRITAAAADLGNVSGDTNINSFGAAITSAAAAGRLPDSVFSGLNSLTSNAEFEAAALTLLPAINDGVVREIYESQRLASSRILERFGEESVGVWGGFAARDVDADGSSLSSQGYDARSAEITLGVDGKVGETARVGILFSYSDIDITNDGTAQASSEIDAFQIGAYGGFDLGQITVAAEIGYSTSSVDSTRTALGSTGPGVSSDSDVDGVYASLNAAYELDAGAVAITPSVGLRFADLSRDRFTESGALDLTLDQDGSEFFEASAGVRVAGKAETGFIPFASVDYAYDFSADPTAIAGSFNGGADAFRVVADEAAASRFDVSAGFDFIADGTTTIGAEYNGRFASDYQSHSGAVRLRIGF